MNAKLFGLALFLSGLVSLTMAMDLEDLDPKIVQAIHSKKIINIIEAFKKISDEGHTFYIAKFKDEFKETLAQANKEELKSVDEFFSDSVKEGLYELLNTVFNEKVKEKLLSNKNDEGMSSESSLSSEGINEAPHYTDGSVAGSSEEGNVFSILSYKNWSDAEKAIVGHLLTEDDAIAFDELVKAHLIAPDSSDEEDHQFEERMYLAQKIQKTTPKDKESVYKKLKDMFIDANVNTNQNNPANSPENESPVRAAAITTAREEINNNVIDSAANQDPADRSETRRHIDNSAEERRADQTFFDRIPLKMAAGIGVAGSVAAFAFKHIATVRKKEKEEGKKKKGLKKQTNKKKATN